MGIVCYIGIVYDRQVSEDQRLTFGVSGMLYRNGLIMYDHQTESLWSHVLGQAVAGEYAGQSLTFIPTLQIDWKSWQEIHPDTLVVSPDLYGPDQYERYYYSPAEGIDQNLFGSGSRRDSEIYPKQFVIGLKLAAQTRAYPFFALHKKTIINDHIGQTPIAVFFDKMTLTGTVFDRRLDGTITLIFEPGSSAHTAIDTDTGSVWHTLTGRAIAGPRAGAELTRLPITHAFWFGWIDNYPESTVYAPSK
jgi:hypothetical protein